MREPAADEAGASGSDRLQPPSRGSTAKGIPSRFAGDYDEGIIVRPEHQVPAATSDPAGAAPTTSA